MPGSAVRCSVRRERTQIGVGRRRKIRFASDRDDKKGSQTPQYSIRVEYTHGRESASFMTMRPEHPPGTIPLLERK